MKKGDSLVKIFSGNEVKVYLLKGILENAGISASVSNDSGDSFLRGVPAAVDLYIRESELQKAGPLLKKFFLNNKS